MGHPGVHRLRLEPKVEFLGEVVGEVGDDVLCAEAAAQLGQLDQLSAALEDLQIGGHAAADAGALNLHDDLFAGVQCRVVHLRDRRRGERLLVEALEEVGGVVAEFLLEELVHLFGVGRWHPVEQAAELARHRLAKRARAGGDDLAELDVGGSRSEKVCGICLMIFCWSEPRPASLLTTRAPVRVICHPVTPMRRPRPATAPDPAWLPRGVWWLS